MGNQLFFAGPALYENRYWTMWKLPMFGCQSGDEVLKEIEECQKEYPGYRVRVWLRQSQTGSDGWLHRQNLSWLLLLDLTQLVQSVLSGMIVTRARSTLSRVGRKRLDRSAEAWATVRLMTRLSDLVLFSVRNIFEILLILF